MVVQTNMMPIEHPYGVIFLIFLIFMMPQKFIRLLRRLVYDFIKNPSMCPVSGIKIGQLEVVK